MSELIVAPSHLVSRSIMALRQRSAVTRTRGRPGTCRGSVPVGPGRAFHGLVSGDEPAWLRGGRPGTRQAGSESLSVEDARLVGGDHVLDVDEDFLPPVNLPAAHTLSLHPRWVWEGVGEGG